MKTQRPGQVGVQTQTDHQPAAGHRWLGPGLFVLSVAGLPLLGLLLARLRRRGVVVLEAACTLLLARAIHFVVTGTPARLRRLPRLLAYAELATDGVAAASGFWVWVWIWQPLARHRQATWWEVSLSRLALAAMFILHSVRMAIYLSPGHGLRSGGGKPELSPVPPASRPREIAPGVYRVVTGQGISEADVYFVRSESGWVLIDAAWPNRAQLIQQAAQAVFGVGARPDAILLTHIHPDHSGSVLELARMWGVPVYVHPNELPFPSGQARYSDPIDRWLVRPLMHFTPRRQREAILSEGKQIAEAVSAFDPGAGVPGLPDWVCIPTPGHTPGHVAFFRPTDRVLITGDALLTVDLNSFWGWLSRVLRPNTAQISGPPYISTWSWYTTIGVVSRVDADVVRHRLRRAPARTVGGVLVGVGLLATAGLAALVVPALSNPASVDPLLHARWIVDFTVGNPVLLIGGVLLWRRSGLGYAAAAGLLFLSGANGVAFAVGGVLGALVTATSIEATVIAVHLVIATLSFLVLVLFLNNVRRM